MTPNEFAQWKAALMFALFLLFLTALAFTQTPPPSILVDYKCTGVSGNHPYKTELVIKQQEGNYFLNWNDGNQGMGFRKGDQLVVVFVTQKGGLGVVLYSITPGRLEGLWAAGDGQIYPETCMAGIPA